ncbi:MAG: FkbM family methyltransferase [Alphaproteobacteria bacterium]
MTRDARVERPCRTRAAPADGLDRRGAASSSIWNTTVPKYPPVPDGQLQTAPLAPWHRIGLIYRTLKHVASHGRAPTPRRRAVWRSRAPFRQAVARLGPADVAIDAGANVGDFTWPLARRGVEVHAFDPEPYAVEISEHRFASFPNVTIHRTAVSGTAGELDLFRAPAFETDPGKHSKSSSVIATKRNIDPTTAIRVPAIDLGEFIQRCGDVALLKMDIEGAEVDVLEKLLDAGLLGRIPYVFVETHEDKIPALAEPMARLRQRMMADGLNHVDLDWA